jgi:mannan endo-1,4-beta-mannosidase
LEEEKMSKKKILAFAIVMMLIVSLLCGTVVRLNETKAAPSIVSTGIDVSSLKGVNHAHTWYPDRLVEALQGIRSWGANSVRIVLSNGCKWAKNSASDVANVISKAQQLGFTAVILEVHDTTGYGEDSSACSLNDAVAYWKEIQSVLIGKEDFVIINIGNEPYGNNNYQNWTQDTIDAINALREAGFNHTIMVDAPNWGQDWSFTMRDNAPKVYAADPNKNMVFSIHMYGVYNTAQKVYDYFQAFKDMNLPLVVGEFGNQHSDGDPDEEAIVSYAKQYGIGYLGWSWCGNSGGVEYLDMVSSWDANSPTSWGSWFKTNALAEITPPSGDTVPPAVPTGLTATTVSSSSINLDWADNTDSDLAGYKVYRSTTSDFTPGSANFVKQVTTSAYTDTGLTADTTYYYKVTAVDTSGNESQPSAQASAKTQQDGGTTPPGEYTQIGLPFTHDGAGEYYWKTNKLSTDPNDWSHYINSWNVDLLEINGKDYTNVWVAQHQIAPSSDGYWYIHYKGSFSYSHVEIK